MEEWRFEAVLCTILELTDGGGRLLCPPFRVLAPPDKFPLYYDTIEKPIDLQTLARRVRDGAYADWAAFTADLKLLFKNARTFNEPGSVIYKDAGVLNTQSLQKCNEMKEAKRLNAKE